jgi:hypothetical protein
MIEDQRRCATFGTTLEFGSTCKPVYELDKAKREKLAQIRAETPRRSAA